MRLGLMLGYAAGKMELPIDLVQEADRLGVHAVWTAEAYGSDAVTPLAWLGALTERIKLGTAIMQMPGRTPANSPVRAISGPSSRAPGSAIPIARTTSGCRIPIRCAACRRSTAPCATPWPRSSAGSSSK